MMAEIKGLIDDNGIIYECNKIFPEEYKIKLLEVLAEIEDNECHKNQSFPKSKLHKVVGAKKVYRAYIDKVSGWRLHYLQSMEEESAQIAEIPVAFEREYSLVQGKISELTEKLSAVQKSIRIQNNRKDATYNQKYTLESISRFLGKLQYKNIEKVELRNKYNIIENPGAKLTKYLVDLKATQAFTKDAEKEERILNGRRGWIRGWKFFRKSCLSGL